MQQQCSSWHALLNVLVMMTVVAETGASLSRLHDDRRTRSSPAQCDASRSARIGIGIPPRKESADAADARRPAPSTGRLSSSGGLPVDVVECDRDRLEE